MERLDLHRLLNPGRHFKWSSDGGLHCGDTSMPCQHFLDAYPEESGFIGTPCPFHVDEEELILFDRQQWCPFHLPMVDIHGTLGPKSLWSPERVKVFNQEILRIIDQWFVQDRILDFTGVVFPSGMDFRGVFTSAKPSRHILMGGTQFYGPVTFQNAMFPWWIRFDYAVFHNKATFVSTTFHFVSFNQAKFCKDALFLHADFLDFAQFRGAIFMEDAVFEGKTLGVKGRRFSDTVFDGAHFGRQANFNNRLFLNTADFGQSRFARAPAFHGAHLHQDTRLTQAHFIPDHHPQTPMAFRTLRHAMAEMHDREMESRFFTLEKESTRRQPQTPKLDRFFLGFYRWTSGYGNSLLRPLVSMTVASVLYFMTFVVLAVNFYSRFEWKDGWEIFHLLLLRPPSTSLTTPHWMDALLREYPLVTGGASGLHGFFLLVFIFFLLVAIRRRLSM